MRSLQERFSDTITELKRLGNEPSIEDVDALRSVIDDLDHELRTTAREPVDRYGLTELSDQARSLLTNAHARARTALDIAEAARQREIHAIEHPTVLDPDPPQRSALHGFTGNALSRYMAPEFDGFDGFER